MSMKISVIIPVYNVQAYISKCILSIINQDYDNLDIILINDGSQDESGDICDSFAQLDSRINVIHKKNGGLSDARNVGLDASVGEYITFVDSDDFVEPIYISTLLSIVTKYKTKIGVTLFEYFKSDDTTTTKSIETSQIHFSKIDALKTMMYQDKFDNNATAKLFHRSLFENINFPKDLLFEDLLTTYKLILLCDNGVAFSDHCTYKYLLREDSIEGSPFNQKKKDSLDYILQDLERLKSSFPIIEKSINCRMLSLCFHLFFETKKNSLYEKQIFNLAKKYRLQVLKDTNGRRKTRIAIILSYFGNTVLRYFYQFAKSRA